MNEKLQIYRRIKAALHLSADRQECRLAGESPILENKVYIKILDKMIKKIETVKLFHNKSIGYC